MANHLIQHPEPGKRLLLFAGDAITFTLTVQGGGKGAAWLRTNLDQTRVTRTEIIREVELGEHPLGRDWFDIPMVRTGGGNFTLTLPLCDPGHFQCKCFFQEEGRSAPLWPEGGNTVLNVEPAGCVCANSVYNAFVRQFGPNKAGKGEISPTQKEWGRALDKLGYSVIPPSGKFRDLAKELDFIVTRMGCRIIQLLPIHPTPTTYAKLGRFGSPYAALSFTGVDPALAEFDPKATPMEQFTELVDAIHAHDAKIFLDIAINHTGWAARLHETHPEWLSRSPDGEIEMPGAWGVVWGDLTRLDYSHKGLWKYMAGIFLTWLRRGVDGFRADAGYMIPVEAWRYIVAKVREQFPDALFLLEGLGGYVHQTEAILDTANFDMAYSELFQNYDRGQIENYLPGVFGMAGEIGLMLHFAETHDNSRLAAKSPVYAKMRTALCALFSQNGAFAFANGVEWLATEKIDVHRACSLNWGAQANQVDHITRLNRILTQHPAFGPGVRLSLIQREGGDCLALLRHHPASNEKLLVLVNLDHEKPVTAHWDGEAGNLGAPALWDLLTNAQVKPEKADNLLRLNLEPGQVLCLSPDKRHADAAATEEEFASPALAERQRLRAKALSARRFFRGTTHLGDVDPDQMARDLAADPEAFLLGQNTLGQGPGFTHWQWPQDKNREVMVLPGNFLLVWSGTRFDARIMKNNRVLASEKCFEISRDQAREAHPNRAYFALFNPLDTPRDLKNVALHLAVYEESACIRAKGALLLLPEHGQVRLSQVYSRRDLSKIPALVLGTNGRGAMMRANARWGDLDSRYDALLAANLNPRTPEDRWIMLTRCRAWVVYQGSSREINFSCLDHFRAGSGSKGFWRFTVPCGQGQYVILTLGAEMIPDKNAVALTLFRDPGQGRPDQLPAGLPVEVVLRPDIEDRSFHETTKAFTGPEQGFPRAVKAAENGFTFTPHPDRKMVMQADPGSFFIAPEWYYMVHRKVEAQRGLDPDSDLFSPGWFSIKLQGGQTARLWCGVNQSEGDLPAHREAMENLLASPDLFTPAPIPLDEAARLAMEHFVVKRDDAKTVIAGYPWFLDWGRDSLIFLRGLIAAGRVRESGAILKQFAMFESDGTLPNMIRGNDVGNRDTSDAPLWFFTACRDLAQGPGSQGFLDEPCGKRTIRQVLASLVRSIMAGTPNGVKMDPGSGLVFSPSHFTWMDTNFPAGTPRQGYPVEIQALWFAALDFMASLDKEYAALAKKVSQSIEKCFFDLRLGYMADCLHAHSGQPADKARKDDALRPNQLLAVTLGAVKDEGACKAVAQACEELVTPGAIRSLADRPVRTPLPIVLGDRALNDPHQPYCGHYQGDEDSSRKPAYHNGTAWTWMFPVFCEAWAMAHGEGARTKALSWLTGSARLFRQGAGGQIPEILDGNYPHASRGCDSQAWGVSEFYRVYKKLTQSKDY